MPALSVARTSKVCAPVAREAYVWGDVHGVKAAPSSEQANEAIPEPLPSLPVNAKVAPVVFVNEAGLKVIVVSGGAVSIVHR